MMMNREPGGGPSVGDHWRDDRLHKRGNRNEREQRYRERDAPPRSKPGVRHRRLRSATATTVETGRSSATPVGGLLDSRISIHAIPVDGTDPAGSSEPAVSK
jgi:hypothetical protein